MAKPVLQNEKRPCMDVCSSSLFWWIVMLMAFPVFLTNVIIGGIATSSVSGTIPIWTENAEKSSDDIEKEILQFIADRKASIISTLVEGPARDLHLMTRITNWLFFEGIQRSDSLTEMDTATEECKEAVHHGEQCPYYTADRMPCSCDWECQQEMAYPWGCLEYNVSDSRYLQRNEFVVQKLDSDPVTGNRKSSPSFPELSNSPINTSWWKDVFELPGAEKGTAASGYRTLFDRVAVSSASSIFNFPVYNYATSLNREKQFLGGFLAFDDDGLFTGWNGCNYGHATYSGFESSPVNGAFLVDPVLCPEGKFGYDPRCRSWYAIGKEKYLNWSIPVHATSPYRFASNGVIASSITSPIAHPESKEYVGQVLLDYLPQGLDVALHLLEEPLSFIVTPGEDVLGGDTVIGPNKTEGWKSAPIGDLIFLYEPNSTNRDYFEEEILALMKDGQRGQKEFSWTKKDGSLEQICLSFAPISVRIMLGMMPDQFEAGVQYFSSLIYSIGVGKPCADIHKPFDTIGVHVNEDLESIGVLYLSITVISTVFFIVFSAVVAAYIGK
jgi:hypothetical protein